MSYVLEFERFRLYPQQRLLLDNSAAIDVPGRAMDVLIADSDLFRPGIPT